MAQPVLEHGTHSKTVIVHFFCDKTLTKSNLRKEQFVSASKMQPLIEGIQGRNFRPEPRSRNWSRAHVRTLLTVLISMAYSACFLGYPRTTCLAGVPPTMDLSLLYQLLIKRMFYILPSVQSDGVIFLIEILSPIYLQLVSIDRSLITSCLPQLSSLLIWFQKVVGNAGLHSGCKGKKSSIISGKSSLFLGWIFWWHGSFAVRYLSSMLP